METVKLIASCAEIPSFSSYEERLHPFIKKKLADLPQVKIEKVPANNLFIAVPGKRDMPPVAITAHLDKINHFGENITHKLPVTITHEKIAGQLDDAVGVGMCLSLLRTSRQHKFPPLFVLLSEMEESVGLKNHPHLLKNNGVGLHSSMGAERIAHYLLDTDQRPAVVITIDTTPLFKGEKGLALYANHWEKNDLTPSDEMVKATQSLQDFFLQINPAIKVNNNVNDYLVYGRMLNQNHTLPPMPSLALEPAICPYHQLEESVFLSDITQAMDTLTSFLEQWTFVG